ncbi:hypothetical protein K1J50_18840, partial [Caldovatus sp. SYSU G05006]|nr:hypothetical protein [Caldovatus aquaticus]
ARPEGARQHRAAPAAALRTRVEPGRKRLGLPALQQARQRRVRNGVFDSYDAIADACCDAWNWLADQPERITAIASRAYAEVKLQF